MADINDDIEKKIESMKQLLLKVAPNLARETVQSFELVINYYSDLIYTDSSDRNSELYSLKSTYSLLQLSATYDIAVKEIFAKLISNPISENSEFSKYLDDILKINILNRYMTNIKHEGIKKKFKITLDQNNPDIQTHANNIDSLIKTRNTIAHELKTESKGHNDVESALFSVLNYLVWYQDELNKKISTQSTT